jgi:hypothetical protein
MAIRNSYQQHISSKNPKRFNEGLLCLDKNIGGIFFDGNDRSFGTAKKLRYTCLCT